MTYLAIIPARGGSKRIPGKNIRDFCGYPIIRYPILAAKKFSQFQEIMVSTDDNEIARIAKKYGANVPFMRSTKTSDDFATTTDVILEVLDEYNKININFSYFCCMYPTSIFITPEIINEMLSKLFFSSADSIISVIKYGHPIQRSLKIINNKLKYLHPENMFVRTQDLESTYYDAGQIYCCKVSSFLEQKSLIMDNTLYFEMNETNSQDIDTENDFKIAELKYKFNKKV